MPQCALVGRDEDDVKSLVRLVVINAVGRDLLDDAFETAIDREVIGGELYEGFLPWPYKGDIARLHLCLDEKLVLERNYVHHMAARVDERTDRIGVECIDDPSTGERMSVRRLCSFAPLMVSSMTENSALALLRSARASDWICSAASARLLFALAKRGVGPRDHLLIRGLLPFQVDEIAFDLQEIGLRRDPFLCMGLIRSYSCCARVKP